MDEQKFNELKEKVVNNDLDHVIGQTKVKNQLKSAVISNRHVIIVGPPGIGKTTLAKNLTDLLPKIEDDDGNTVKAPFVRIQGSPELTTEDLIGDIDPLKALEYGPMSIEAFTPGKIFKADKGILFFDEVNRCTEKLQNSLLQVLEEGSVTIGSYDVDIPSDFLLIGTMNPEESATEPLSDVFLDRFDIIYMEAPSRYTYEEEIVLSKGKKMCDFPEDLLKRTIEYIRDLRHSKDLEKHPSVRATIGIYERSQSNAIVAGRTKVTGDDVEDALISVLSHRIRLKPSLKYVQNTSEYIREEFQKFEDNQGKTRGGP